MRKTLLNQIRRALVIVLAVAMGVAFMPAGTAKVNAATFSTTKAVSGLTVSAKTASTITLKWNAFTKADGYLVYRATSKTGAFERINRTTKTSWKRTGLTTNKTCYYKVRAFYTKSDGTFSYSKYSTVISGTPVGFNPQDRVQGFKVAATGYSSVKFVWDKYPKATGYQIYRATKKNGEYIKCKTINATTYKRSSLTTNTTCYYKIRAYKKKANGKTIYTKFSTYQAATPRMKTPALSVSSNSTNVSGSWTKVAGATGYLVYRAESKTGKYTRIAKTSTLAFSDTTAEKNKTYYYKMRAYRTLNSGYAYSSYSTPQQGVKVSIGKVSGVKASSGSTSVSLSWTSVSGASGYQIYRATGSGGKYTNVGTSTKNSFSDVNVANGLTYYYKVRAYKNINGKNIYGSFSTVGFSRSDVVSAAVAWLGCKESNKSNKPIVDLYNKNMGTSFSYTTPWCAIFVSAVAIKTGTTSIIVRGSYCPTVINTYKKSTTKSYSYGSGSSYVPKAGDVIFFDWNRNGVPDHTGLVASVSGKTIKTIEGNYSDAVGYRTFSVGYKYVQGYGLPNYDDANGIVYTGKSNTSVGCGELSAVGIGTEPEGIEELGEEYDFVEQNLDENIGDSEDVSEYDKMVYMVSKVRSSAETEGIDCSQTQYYAAFIYKLCSEAGIDGSIMTVEDEEGTTHAWVEACLDETWYQIDASKEADQITEFEPEATDVEE